MLTRELNYTYSDDLIATEKSFPPRVMWVDKDQSPQEISFQQLLAKIPSGDVLVINDTKVVKQRVFAGELEILFLQELADNHWQVLFPSKNLKVGAQIDLPMNATAELISKGRPQTLKISRKLIPEDFEQWGELPLPPYIQRARHERHNRSQDKDWYQTRWAKNEGSLASPTASLHFRTQDIELLKSRGVKVHQLTLHVGLGTFLPLTAEKLSDHEMHSEEVQIPAETWAAIEDAHSKDLGIWALGTTSARSIESAAQGLLQPDGQGGFKGATNLFMRPGATWARVNRLMTNFHQPESTLLALVASFHSWESVKLCYQWAVQKRFKLFSYGDFSVWIR